MHYIMLSDKLSVFLLQAPLYCTVLFIIVLLPYCLCIKIYCLLHVYICVATFMFIHECIALHRVMFPAYLSPSPDLPSYHSCLLTSSA